MPKSYNCHNYKAFDFANVLYYAANLEVNMTTSQWKVTIVLPTSL